MEVGRASLVDVNGMAQVRTYHYPYTYTFYSIEHFLEHHGFDVRLSSIAQGRILVHFDESVPLSGGQRGFADLTIEPTEDITFVKMVAGAYSTIDDTIVIDLRKRTLKGIQRWLDEQRTMAWSPDDEDIPRFRNEHKGRLLKDRPTRLGAPDTEPLARFMLHLGTLMSVTGLVMVVIMGIMPWWAHVLVLMSGFPFILISRLIDEGLVEESISLYATVGLIAGLAYLFTTVCVGLVFVLYHLALIDYELRKYRVWEEFRSKTMESGHGEGTPWIRPRFEEPKGKIPRPGIVY
jgi:hypothetical protein